jgi:receptor expression-enhancing protein 5/6|tara:strand:+ start:49 stop:687 length:639 start_codon:yes stop_codon:yes gene_type:complete
MSLDSAVAHILGSSGDLESAASDVPVLSTVKDDNYGDLTEELQSVSLVVDDESVDVREFVVWVGVFLILILLVTLSLTSGYGARILCTLSGFLYPCIMSLKAAATEDIASATQWSTYWIIFGSFTLVESVVDPFSYFSLYYVVKFGVELYCYYPQTQGATVVYNTCLRQLVETHVEYLAQFEANATAVSKKLNTQLKFKRAKVVYRKVFKSG